MCESSGNRWRCGHSVVNKYTTSATFALLSIVLCAMTCVACGGESSGDVLDAEVADSGAVTGEYDGGFLSYDWPVLPPCHRSHIEIPGTITSRITHWNGLATYARIRSYTSMSLNSDIFLYDLNTCTEYLLTYKDGDQSGPFIRGSHVLFYDYPDGTYSILGPLFSDIVRFDTNTHDFTYVTQGANAFYPSHNAQYVAFFWASPGAADLIYMDLGLLNLSTGESTGLYDATTTRPGSVSISDTHLAWSEYQIPGVWAFAYTDLATGDVTRISTAPGLTFVAPSVWGDWLVWSDEREGTPNVYARDLRTEVDHQLTDDGYAHEWPILHGSIACWRTDRYSQGNGWDLLLHDMDTGVERRLTYESRPDWKPGYVQAGWITYADGVRSEAKAYAEDLVALGLVDEDGSLLPE